MKLIKQFTCLVACFVVLSSSFMVGYAVDDPFPTVPEEPFYDELFELYNPYAISILDITAVYEWLPSNNFGITDAILKNSKFLFYEELPYGMNTVILSFNNGGSLCFFFVNGADSVSPALRQTWSSSGNCAVSILSLSPVYRVAFNPVGGYAVSFGGYTGLTNSNNSTTVIDSVTYYGYSYNFGAQDYYAIFSDNHYLIEKSLYLNGESDDAIFGVCSYPTLSDLQNELQKEHNETSKSIWETLKSVLEYIKNLPSNIANSIKEFFDNLGDRISEFFTTLKNYLLYFQAEEPEDESYSSVDFLSYLTKYITELSSNLQEFTESLDSSFNSIESYITSGSNIINKLLGGVPILNAVLIFFLAFAVIRKAVGR